MKKGKINLTVFVVRGFFYSIDNVPVSFQNSGENLTRLSASEWEWRGEGDNRGYIRQIEPYWFYFEASL